MTIEELQSLLTYGPAGGKQEARELAQTALSLMHRLKGIENFCLDAKRDRSEIRWVRMFAHDVLKKIDSNRDWDEIAYGGGV